MSISYDLNQRLCSLGTRPDMDPSQHSLRIEGCISGCLGRLRCFCRSIYEPYAPPAKPGFTPVQKAVLPSSQFLQRPSATLKGRTILSPSLRSVTPAPNSMTVPIFSCLVAKVSKDFSELSMVRTVDSYPKTNPDSAAVRPWYLVDGWKGQHVSRTSPKLLHTCVGPSRKCRTW